jgi:hypothetical protein
MPSTRFGNRDNVLSYIEKQKSASITGFHLLEPAERKKRGEKGLCDFFFGQVPEPKATASKQKH